LNPICRGLATDGQKIATRATRSTTRMSSTRPE
jgi:hypothetical protein